MTGFRLALASFAVLIVVAIVVAPSSALAETGPPPRVRAEVAVPIHKIDVAATLHWFDYREFVPEPLKSEERGAIPGARIAYRFSHWGFLVGASLAVSGGDTTYDGSFQDGTPLLDTSNNWFVDWSVRAGARLDGLLFDAPLLLAPWIGIGQHWWNRGLGGPQPFDELYRWLRVSFGVEFEAPLGPVWVGADVSADLMAMGRITFEFSDIDPEYNDPETDLGGRPGATVRAWIGVPVSEHVEIALTGWYRYSAIEESSEPALLEENGEFVLAVIEPSSRSHRAGADLGVVLRF